VDTLPDWRTVAGPEDVDRLVTEEDELQERPDRYPDLHNVIDAVVHQDDFPQEQVDRIEIRLHASGVATWRAWLSREEEPVGGMIDTDS
jgi:hypothetical protein